MHIAEVCDRCMLVCDRQLIGMATVKPADTSARTGVAGTNAGYTSMASAGARAGAQVKLAGAR